MSQQVRVQQDAWVRRVLGLAVGHGGAPPERGRAAAAIPLLPIWREAREALDAQIMRLGNALRDQHDPELDRIADLGFNGLTGRSSTALMVALLQYDAQPGALTAKAVRAALAGFAALVQPGSLLDDYDRNPFGAKVAMRATLEQALAELRTALAANQEHDAP